MPASTTSAFEIVPKEVIAAILVQPLEQASIMLSSGVRILDTNGGNLIRAPKLVGMTEQRTFIGENEQIPDETEPNFDEATLLPRSMKSVKTITRFSANFCSRASWTSKPSCVTAFPATLRQ